VKSFVNGLSFTLLRSPSALKGIAVFERFKRLKTNTKGATAIEYGLILALIAVAIIGAVTNFATGVSNLWFGVSNKIENEINKN
jgi:pilus assembly protein Flp/PilA